MAGFINVVLVDDREGVRAGLARILNQAPGIQVVAEVASVADVAVLSIDPVADVLLVDLNVQDAPRLEAIGQLTHAMPELKVLVITVYAAEPMPQQLWQVGVSGYLGRGCPVGEMVNAIKAVHAGQRYPTADKPQYRIPQNRQLVDSSPFTSLVPREMQLMRLLLEGRPMQAIAEACRLKLETVAACHRQLHEKLGVSNDIDLERLARHHGVFGAGSAD